jgi:hypothetical protein
MNRANPSISRPICRPAPPSRPRSVGKFRHDLARESPQCRERATDIDHHDVLNSKWHSTHPTNAHERRSKELGLPPDKVEAILCGLSTAFSAREEVVYEIAMA